MYQGDRRNPIHLPAVRLQPIPLHPGKASSDAIVASLQTGESQRSEE